MSTIRKLAVASVLAAAVSASQAAVVDTFTYELDLNWVTTPGDTPTFSTATSALSSTHYDSSKITWGYWNGNYANAAAAPDYAQSALVIGSPHVTGAVQTNGDAAAANMFTHYNSAISGYYSTLQTAQLSVSVKLFAPDVGKVQNITTVFDVHFVETPNTGGMCEWGPCDNDIFAILAVDPKLNDLTRSFTYGGQEYVLSYFETTNMLNPLSSAACTAAGVSGGCYGFTTLESNRTDVKFALSIKADVLPPVPEPETYAMLLAGLGLMGIVARRRKL